MVNSVQNYVPSSVVGVAQPVNNTQAFNVTNPSTYGNVPSVVNPSVFIDPISAWDNTVGNPVGTSTPKSTITPTSLGVGAGTGYAIGTANITGGNRTGSQIGGTVGGIAGKFLPFPGGSVVGSFIGSAIGGMFGGKPKANWSHFANEIDSSGNSVMYKTDTKQLDTTPANTVNQGYTEYMKALGKSGVKFDGTINILGGFNDKYHNGYFLRVGEYEKKPKDFNFDPKDPNSMVDAYTQATLYGLETRNRLTPELQKQIQDQGQIYKQQLAKEQTLGKGTSMGDITFNLNEGTPDKSFSAFLQTHNQQQTQNKV